MPTRSPRVALSGVQVPRVRHAPSVRANDWEDVADLAKAYGLILDPWQENVLAAAMGVRADGQWASPTVGVSVPRQNGKGAIIEARELAGLLLFGEKTIIHSAHEQKTARMGFDRILSYFENYDDLRKKVRGKPMAAVGREHIKLRNGAALYFPARSKGAIRGFSIDCLILDEAQILGDPAWEAIKPTISARENVQTWLLGTPPTPLDDGAVFTRIRRRGLEGKDHRLCWCEWSAPKGSAHDDREAWATANPALGLRITAEAIADEMNELSPFGFARERLGIWDDDPAAHSSPIDSEAWSEQAAERVASDTPPTALAVDQWYDGTTAIGAAWRTAGGSWHVEVLAMDYVHDNATVVKQLTEWAGRKIPVGVPGDSPAAAMIGDLRAAGVKVNVLSIGDQGKACGGLLTDLIARRLTYKPEPQLDTAAEGARKSLIGTSGLWRWGRVDPSVNLTPLTVITWARFAATLTKRRNRTGESVFR